MYSTQYIQLTLYCETELEGQEKEKFLVGQPASPSDPREYSSMLTVSPRCNGSRYSGSLAIPDALRMWGATRFQAGKSRFIIPDGSYNAARSDRTQLLSDVFPCPHIYVPRYNGRKTSRFWSSVTAGADCSTISCSTVHTFYRAGQNYRGYSIVQEQLK